MDLDLRLLLAVAAVLFAVATAQMREKKQLVDLPDTPRRPPTGPIDIVALRPCTSPSPGQVGLGAVRPAQEGSHHRAVSRHRDQVNPFFSRSTPTCSPTTNARPKRRGS